MKNEGGKLEVIGAGFGRTGTTSLHEALNILGMFTFSKRHQKTHKKIANQL